MEEIFKAVNDSLYELEIKTPPPKPSEPEGTQKHLEGYKSLIEFVFSLEELGFSNIHDVITAMKNDKPNTPFKKENIGSFLIKNPRVQLAQYTLEQIRAFAKKGYFKIEIYTPSSSSIINKYPHRMVTRDQKYIYVKADHINCVLSFLIKPTPIAPVSLHDPSLFSNPDRDRLRSLQQESK